MAEFSRTIFSLGMLSRLCCQRISDIAYENDENIKVGILIKRNLISVSFHKL